MIIETRFDVDEKTVIIDNDKIITLPVAYIEYTNKSVRYFFCTSKALTSMDKDRYVCKDENECFKSIKELGEYYESKQNR